MIDAWLSSSEQTSVPGPPNVVSTPRFAAKPVGNSTAASACFQAASSRSSSEWTGRRADDEAGRAGAGAPAVERGVRGRDDRRVLGEAEVVVRRERDDRAAVGRELALRARRRRSPRGARHWPASVADRRSPASRRSAHSGPAHGRSVASPSLEVGDLVDRLGERVHDAVDLLGGDGERRHEDHDVAERAEQHAALDRGRAHPAAPAQPVASAARARRRPSGRAAGRRATSGSEHDAVVEQVAQLVGPGAHVGEHVLRVDAARGGAARPRRRARSRCRSARGTASARRGRGRGTRRTPRPTRRSPTSGGTRR